MAYTQKQLFQLARENGIKYYSRKSKSWIAEKLGIALLPVNTRSSLHFEKHVKDKLYTPVKTTLTSVKSGEKTEFKSGHAAAKHLGVNQGSISFAKKRQKPYKGYYVN